MGFDGSLVSQHVKRYALGEHECLKRLKMNIHILTGRRLTGPKILPRKVVYPSVEAVAHEGWRSLVYSSTQHTPYTWSKAWQFLKVCASCSHNAVPYRNSVRGDLQHRSLMMAT